MSREGKSMIIKSSHALCYLCPGLFQEYLLCQMYLCSHIDILNFMPVLCCRVKTKQKTTTITKQGSVYEIQLITMPSRSYLRHLLYISLLINI